VVFTDREVVMLDLVKLLVGPSGLVSLCGDLAVKALLVNVGFQKFDAEVADLEIQWNGSGGVGAVFDFVNERAKDSNFKVVVKPVWAHDRNAFGKVVDCDSGEVLFGLRVGRQDCAVDRWLSWSGVRLPVVSEVKLFGEKYEGTFSEDLTKSCVNLLWLYGLSCEYGAGIDSVLGVMHTYRTLNDVERCRDVWDGLDDVKCLPDFDEVREFYEVFVGAFDTTFLTGSVCWDPYNYCWEYVESGAELIYW
jgi:hypothetical protein